MKMVDEDNSEVPMESSLQAGKLATILYNVAQKAMIKQFWTGWLYDVMQSLCTAEGITEKDNVQLQNDDVDILLLLDFSYCQ